MLTGKGSGKNISGFLPTDPELLRKAKESSSLKREIKKINIYEYIEEEWFSIESFINSLEHGLQFMGIGFFPIEETGQFPGWKGYFVLKLNETYYGLYGESRNGKPPYMEESIIFKGVVKLNPKFNELNPFKGHNRIPRSTFKLFPADIIVDIKLYSYEQQEKVTISKHGNENIELYVTFELDKRTNYLNLKISANALEQATRHMAMIKTLDERLEKVQGKNNNE